MPADLEDRSPTRLGTGMQTPFCRRLGLTVPVVQAPIGSAATPELAAAVSNAGGLGMLALTWAPHDAVRDRIRAVRALTDDRPFGVNLILQWPQHARVQACADESVAVVSTFWGDPRPYVDAIHAGGALHVHTVGSADEAVRAVEAGVDVIVAQGWEAGGRVRGEVATLPLVPAVVDAVCPVPVIAAGGVGDGRGLAAVLVLGADAGWVGTAFCWRMRRASTMSGDAESSPRPRRAPCIRRSSTEVGQTRPTAHFAIAPWTRGSAPDDRSAPGAPVRRMS